MFSSHLCVLPPIANPLMRWSRGGSLSQSTQGIKDLYVSRQEVLVPYTAGAETAQHPADSSEERLAASLIARGSQEHRHAQVRGLM